MAAANGEPSLAAERGLEPARRCADPVEQLGRGDARRRTELRLQRVERLLGLVDPGRVLGQPERDEPGAELVEVAARRELLGVLESAAIDAASRTVWRFCTGCASASSTSHVWTSPAANAHEIEPRPARARRARRPRGSRRGRRTPRPPAPPLPDPRRAPPPGEHRLAAWRAPEPSMSARPSRASCSRHWARPTTAMRNVLSFGQDPRWRRFLVSRIEAGPETRVLDVATGTAAVALELCAATAAPSSASTRARRCSPRAAAAWSAQRRDAQIELRRGPGAERAAVRGRRRSTRSRSRTCCATSTTRPRRSRELARVVRPGGTVAALEFGVPPRAGLARALGAVGARRAAGGRAHRLARVGARSGASSARASAATTSATRSRAGAAVARGGDRGRALALAQPRRRRRDVGPAGLSAESRPAFYALAPGGWRDYVTLLHPPYTLWHLSYVAIGAALAPDFDARAGSAWTLAAFALGGRVSARTRSTSCTGARSRRGSRGVRSWALAAASIAAAVAIGVGERAGLDALAAAARRVRRASSSARTTSSSAAAGSTATSGSAIAWGALPVLAAYVVMAGSVGVEAALAAAARGAAQPGASGSSRRRCERCGGASVR